MMTIVEFLLARIAEDEAVANKATDGDPVRAVWAYAGMWDTYSNGEVYAPNADSGSPLYPVNVTQDSEGCLPAVQEAQGPHIARHDPARVLRECAAKRRIIGECADNLDCPGGWEYTDTPDLAWHVLTSHAAVYSDHPDFDPAWRMTSM